RYNCIFQIGNQVTAHASVDACIVTVNDDTGAKELVAYVITKKGTVSADNLTRYLSQRLPTYCVPKHFIFLEKFPLNQNGKVDKCRLPKPQRPLTVAEPRPAQGELERTVVNSFKKYTNRQYMANESFFDFGGDSVKGSSMCRLIEYGAF
ncbi:unnamed protein product, partial [Strongylus vulgaris]